MEDLLAEIEACVANGNFYLALFCTLALPDICGALEASDGVARGGRYVAWYDANMPAHYSALFAGSQCYAFRCSTLHQGKTTNPKLGYSRIIFVAGSEVASPEMHLNVLNDALNLDLRAFSGDVVQSVRSWLTNSAANANVQANLAHFCRVRRNGLPGYIEGVDVLS
jgi:hypothetical protein